MWSAATCILEAKKNSGYRCYDNSGYLEHLTCTGPKRFYTIFHVHVFKIGCIQHMPAFMHACVHRHTHTCMLAHAHMHTLACMPAHTHTHTHGYACTHTYACARAHAHTRRHTELYIRAMLMNILLAGSLSLTGMSGLKLIVCWAVACAFRVVAWYKLWHRVKAGCWSALLLCDFGFCWAVACAFRVVVWYKLWHRVKAGCWSALLLRDFGFCWAMSHS